MVWVEVVWAHTRTRTRSCRSRWYRRCLCKLLDGIQDHYTYAQPGIQRCVFHTQELVRRVEEPLAAHLEAEGLQFIQFAFRWVNCLLLREVPFALSIRLWDTYLCEG